VGEREWERDRKRTTFGTFATAATESYSDEYLFVSRYRRQEKGQ
jgi:hypothetical protein